jgi:outer membrane protein assembly factor BamB
LTLDGSAQTLQSSGDASLMALGGEKDGAGFVQLVDRQGKSLWRYITREPIRHVSVSDVGGFVAAGCDDFQVYFFDRRGLLLWRYKCDRKITGVAISRDGNVLCAGSEDNGVYFFDNRNTPRRFVWKLRLEGVVNAVAMVPSGENILAGAADGGIYFLESREGQVAWKAFAKAPVLAVGASKFADIVAAGSEDGSVHCLDLGGRLLWERRTAGAIVDVSVDHRGAFVAALSRDGTVYLFDAKGDLRWSHPVGAETGTVEISKNGDLVFVVTGDGRILCLSADEGLIFDVHAPGEPVGLDVTADSEVFCLLERGDLRVFETRQVFKSLILSLREVILRYRERGADIEGALASEKQAVAALKNFDYKGVYSAVAAGENLLRRSLDKFSQDTEVEKRATARLTELRRVEVEARRAHFDTKAVTQLIEAAAQLIEAREFGKAIARIEDGRAALMDLDRRRDQLKRADQAIAQAKEAIERARAFPGVATAEAEAQLQMAYEAESSRDFSGALEYASLAHEIVMMARRSSPKAIEAEVAEIRQRVVGGRLGNEDAAPIESGLQNAIAYFAGSRNWKDLGEAFELLDSLWQERAKQRGQPAAASRHALEAAAFAYLDAGDSGRAAEIAERALDYKLAAKLRERLKQPDEAARVLARLTTDQKTKRADLAANGRKLDEYIGGLISQKRSADAAAELLKFDRFPEAIALLEGQSNPVLLAFLVRIYFHLGQFERLVAALNNAEAALRQEVEKGAIELMAFLGRLISGHGFVARVMGYGKDEEKAQDLERWYLSEYARVRARAGNDRDADASAVLFALRQGDVKAARAAAEGRQGPFYEWVRDAHVMIDRTNLKGFRKMLDLFARDFVVRSVHMGSTLKSLQPPSNTTDALDEIHPFNLMAQVHAAYRSLADGELIQAVNRRGDEHLKAGDLEKALPFFREAYTQDVFALVPREDLAARIAGIYLVRGKREEAQQAIKAMGLDEAKVYARIHGIPGLEAAEADGPLVAAPAAAAPAEGKRCPSCGELVPRVAVRCFRCGRPIK